MTRWPNLWSLLTGQIFCSAREPAPASSGVSSTDDRQLGRVQMQLAQAAADYRAAKQRWPRDREAIARTWRQFRAARCAQISAEIGR